MKFFLLILAVVLPTFVAAENTVKSPEICELVAGAIQPFVEQKMFYGDLAIAKKGKLVCEFNVSLAEDFQLNANVRNSRFAIASLSKPIISTLILKLHEKGVLNLNASIRSVLPEFNATWASQVTIHHLLSNRSGLPGHFILSGWQSGEFQKSVSSETLLAQIAALELVFEPGEDYLYTNLGWTLLVAIVAEVTGESYENSLNSLVLSPLKMDQTGRLMTYEEQLIEDLRWGKQGGWEVQTPLHMQVFDGGAGLYASAKDLIRFVTGVHASDYLTQDSRTLLFSEHEPYGWRTEEIPLGDNEPLLAHTYDGQLQGYSGLVYHLIQDDVSLVLLNHTGMGFQHKALLANDVLTAYYGMQMPDRTATPSLQLNRSLVDNTWQSEVYRLKQQTLSNPANASLVMDLAQQLMWSGNTEKAIDAIDWLVTSFPDNAGLKQQLDTLCSTMADHEVCLKRNAVAVGLRVLHLVDHNREAWREASPRPTITHMFYPTLEQRITPLMLGASEYPLFYAGDVVVDGTPATQHKHPLVLMSHGTGGSAPQMLWLASALVKAGYIVAAVNHHGNTAFESQKYPEGFLLWWERTADLSQVQKQLLQDPTWASLIDDEKIALVGFSLGGYTTLPGVGGVTNKALFSEYCENTVEDFSCQPQPEFLSVLDAYEAIKHSAKVQHSLARQGDNFRVDNVKAAVAIGAAVIHAFEPASLMAVKTPTMLMVGSEDRIAPNRYNSAYAHDLMPNSELVVIDGARHYSFLSECTEHGSTALPALCDDEGFIRRADAHQAVINKVLPFLQQHLSE